MLDFDKLEEYDKAKTKVLKYVLYKKRSESEVRKKFENSIDQNMLDDIIEDLKSNDYIDDGEFVERFVNEFMALKNMSLKQIKYKLLSKGIDSNTIEDFFYSNENTLKEYEIKSAQNLIDKKSDCDENEIIRTLLKKGFEYDNVKEAIERGNE